MVCGGKQPSLPEAASPLDAIRDHLSLTIAIDDNHPASE
jgi:hypothetical protein